MIAYCAFVIAQRVASSTKREDPVTMESKGDSRGPSAPTASDRKMEAVDIVLLRSSRDSDLLTGIAAPRPPSLQEVVEVQIRESGFRAAARSVRDDLLILPAEQLARIEEITRRWFSGNPGEVQVWIEDQLEREDVSEAFKQAAISGYLEIIALIDPEAAVGITDLLDSPFIELRAGGGQISPAAAIPAAPGFPGDPGFLIRNRK